MKKIPKVEREDFEKVVKGLLNRPPIKREDVKTGKKKAGKVIPPQPPEPSAS